MPATRADRIRQGQRVWTRFGWTYVTGTATHDGIVDLSTGVGTVSYADSTLVDTQEYAEGGE